MTITEREYGELLRPRLREDVPDTIHLLRQDLSEGRVSMEDIEHLIGFIPRERMRRLVYEYAGMDASMFMTLSQQVKLMDSVISQLVNPDGTLKEGTEFHEITLKDALNLSARVTQMILRDLPKVYNLERTARLEQAMGDIMEEFFTVEQQAKVLERLEELTDR